MFCGILWRKNVRTIFAKRAIFQTKEKSAHYYVGVVFLTWKCYLGFSCFQITIIFSRQTNDSLGQPVLMAGLNDYLQFCLFIKVQDTSLEMMHLSKNHRMIEIISRLSVHKKVQCFTFMSYLTLGKIKWLRDDHHFCGNNDEDDDWWLWWCFTMMKMMNYCTGGSVFESWLDHHFNRALK